jgi:hypothetical protein
MELDPKTRKAIDPLELYTLKEYVTDCYFQLNTQPPIPTVSPVCRPMSDGQLS